MTCRSGNGTPRLVMYYVAILRCWQEHCYKSWWYRHSWCSHVVCITAGRVEVTCLLSDACWYANSVFLYTFIFIKRGGWTLLEPDADILKWIKMFRKVFTKSYFFILKIKPSSHLHFLCIYLYKKKYNKNGYDLSIVINCMP